MEKKEWYKSIGVTVAVLAMLLGLWSNIPFATQKDLDELIALKNIDNQWYREQGEDIAGIKKDVENIKEDINEIKQLVRVR